MRTRLVLLLCLSIANAAAASDNRPPPSAALAKKCRALAFKAHPPTLAGSKAGTAKAEREYFAACIRQGGDVDQGNRSQ